MATTKQKQALDDRGLIRHQMRLGAGLIAFGALSIPLFQMTGVLDGQTATAAFAVATGGRPAPPPAPALASCGRFPIRTASLTTCAPPATVSTIRTWFGAVRSRAMVSTTRP
jgi:hypothetical protein